MCNRYRFSAETIELTHVFPELSETRLTPRFNVAPTQQAPVVVFEGETARLETFRWGLVPSWSKDSKGGFLNARSETAPEKPAFRAAFRHRRCLVIAHGFYEWQPLPHLKQPWHFHLKGDALMCFAGLWETWQPPDASQDPWRTYTILTTTSNALVAPLHDRMPVILPPSAWRPWLEQGSSRDKLAPLLAPYDATQMESWPVTPRMNSARFESPECIQAVAPDTGPKQLDLRLQ